MVAGAAYINLGRCSSISHHSLEEIESLCVRERESWRELKRRLEKLEKEKVIRAKREKVERKKADGVLLYLTLVKRRSTSKGMCTTAE